ncbi:hypothetical protein N7456_008873 [Penicillium angulare]|uniref:Uncharacterized protein n=1 Tax=Penicillium angulare TaxID=116970 RepID=A0A9W9F3Q1_9EURO|nr:hypothetical protein N7456_008873 [Penicillium angulare]
MTSQPEAPDDEDLLMEDSLMPQITPNENFAQLSVLDLQLGKPDETLSFNSSLNLTQPTDSNFGWESERSRHFSNFVPPPSPPDYTSSHFEPSVFSSRPTSLYSNGTRPSSAAGEAYDDQFQHVGRHAGQLPLLDTAGNGWVSLYD